MRRPGKKQSWLSALLEKFGSKQRARRSAAAPLRPFQAVSIYRGTQCCEMARKFSEHRFLARHAPQLPLAGCTMPTGCHCKYIKHLDRRAQTRRLIDFGMAPRLFDGKERRVRPGRRAGDR